MNNPNISYTVHCPRCGSIMYPHAAKRDGEWHDMAACPVCGKTHDVCCDEPAAPVRIPVAFVATPGRVQAVA